MWRSTPSELRLFLRGRNSSHREMKTDCIRIYIARKVNVAINPFRAAFFLRVSNSSHGNWRRLRTFRGPESQRGVQPHQSCVFFFFWEEGTLRTAKWRAIVLEYILSGKSTWQSTPSELRFFFFFESKQLYARLKTIEYVSWSGKSAWRSTPSELRFLERKELLAWKLKKIAYFSLSEEMKSKSGKSTWYIKL